MPRYPKAAVAGLCLAVALPFLAIEASAATEEDAAAITRVTEMEAQGVNSGDVEGGLRAYTDDVVVLPPDEPAMQGKDAVRTWLATMHEQFDVDLEYTSARITVAGDWAFENYAGSVAFTPKAGGDTIVEQIKGIHVFRRGADGTWKITHDIWNTDAPPPAME